MRSKHSIIAPLLIAAATSGAANAHSEAPPVSTPAASPSAGMVNTGAAGMPSAVFAAGTGAAPSISHAAAFGAAAANSDEALPETNLAMLLLAALAAMGSVVIRRSGRR